MYRRKGDKEPNTMNGSKFKSTMFLSKMLSTAGSHYSYWPTELELAAGPDNQEEHRFVHGSASPAVVLVDISERLLFDSIQRTVMMPIVIKLCCTARTDVHVF